MRLARIALFATIAAAALTTAASAQFGRITQQEYYKLSVTYAADEAAIRAALGYLGDLPEDNEAILVAFYQEFLIDRAYSDYMHARFGSRLDPSMPQSDALAASLLQATAVILDGVFRLPADAQEQYLAFSRFALDHIAATDPGICLALATADANILDYAAVDFTAFAAMAPSELTALLDLYREAIAAEIEGRGPAIVIGNNEREAGEEALAAATIALIEASPLGDRLGEIDTMDDLTAEEICDLATIVFDAFDQLVQPERSWALEAVLAQGL